MSRVGWIAFAGICLVVVGLWGPWIPHRSAALVLSGWDLAEFVRFLPETAASWELFYLPVWCAGIALALIAAWLADGLAIRVLVFALALGLTAAILPPYPHLVNGYQMPEFRWRFILGASGLLLVCAIMLGSWLLGTKDSRWARAVGGVLLGLAFLGSIPALWQFAQVRDAIQKVYASRLGWGWGVAMFLSGWVVLGAAGGRLLLRQKPD